MSTSANINIINSDGTYSSNRVNFDGYPDHLQIALNIHCYTKLASEQLIAGKEIRSVDIETGEVELYNKEACRNSLSTPDCDEDYSYLYTDGQWKCLTRGYHHLN